MAQQFTLSDGRVVDYIFIGDRSAIPVLWFHGTPGTYLPPPGISDACLRHGLSLIAFSRPGYGSSTRQKGRRVVDTLADAAALLKHHKIDRFFAAGWSGGGPYALSAAARLPGCLAALSIAGLAPKDADGLDWFEGQGEDNIKEFAAGAHGEEALQAFVAPIRQEMLKANLQNTIDSLASILPPVDVEALLSHQELGQHFVAITKEAVKQSADGWVDDDLAFFQPWGIHLGEIQVPVILYQGEADAMVPFGHGRWLSEHISKQYVRPHLLSGQGHISIYVGNVDAMIEELLGFMS